MRKTTCRVAVVLTAAVLSLGFTVGSAQADISWGSRSQTTHGRSGR